MAKRWLVRSCLVIVATTLIGACTTLAAAPDMQIRSDFEEHKLDLDRLRETMLADPIKNFVIYRKNTDTTDNTDPKKLYRPLMEKLNIEWAQKQEGKLSFAVSSAHDLAGDMCQTKVIHYSPDAWKGVSRLNDSSTSTSHSSAINDDWGITSETIGSFDCATCRRQ
ncbi:MAG: hypothetical protein SGJ27_11165 [Candidatus Melainabacteria bacterium]|nr:hypothetical protein [Candidatus Melainabacteria bacterium]